MRKVALHGTTIKKDSEKQLNQVLDRLINEDVAICVTDKFFQKNKSLLGEKFSVIKKIDSSVDVAFSLGGDGTFLDTLLYVGNSNVPILGINLGRLGFLASVAHDTIKESLYLFFKGKYEVEKRTLLQLETDVNIFDKKCYALNECAIIRKDTSSMIMVKCSVNGQYLNTYWADGLMVSTPTGSTAYSLSCGGPLMMPDSKDFVITPISPHNLNVRPLIVSDDSEINLQIESRDRQFLVSLDSRSETIPHHIDITIRKANFQANIVRIEGVTFAETIRNKLGWGYDRRN